MGTLLLLTDVRSIIGVISASSSINKYKHKNKHTHKHTHNNTNHVAVAAVVLVVLVPLWNKHIPGPQPRLSGTLLVREQG